MRYVGSSQSMLHRAKRHRMGLRAGKHNCRALQASFDAGHTLIVVFIGAGGEEPLIAQERRRIALWASRGKCLNFRATPEGSAAASAKAKKQHEEGRFGYDKETAKHRVKWDRSRPHGLSGRKQTEEHKLAARKARHGY